MNFLPITDQEKELIEATHKLLLERYKDPEHHLASGVLTCSGDTYLSINLKSRLGRANICAEAQAIGKAIAEGKTDFISIVAIRKPGLKDSDQTIRLVTPCGLCREVLYDYGPNLWVILQEGNEMKKCKISDLLPLRFNQNNRSSR